jgi:hypothetical protein
MAKPTKPPAKDDEARQLYAAHLLARYCRVVQLLPGDAIEIAPRPGHRISFVHQVDAGGRITRIVVAPLTTSTPAKREK